MKEKDIYLSDLAEEELNEKNIKEEEPKQEDDQGKIENKEVEDKDKRRLINVLDRVKSRLAQKNKKDIIGVYLTKEDFEYQILKGKKRKRVNLSKASKCFYKFLLFVLTTIFLIGSFIIASIKKSAWDVFWTSFKCFIEISCDKNDFIKQANFFQYFLEQLLREPIDLNLIMFWNFFGMSIMRSWGFRKTSFFFLFFNIIILLIVYNISYDNYDSETYKYSFPKISLLFVIWGAMAIFFGASTFLAQQKFIDFYSLFDYKATEEEIEASYKKLEAEMVIIDKVEDIYNDYNEQKEVLIDTDGNENKLKKEGTKEVDIEEQEKKKEKQRRNNINSLGLFSLAYLLAYMGKYGIGIRFKYYQQNNSGTKNSTLYNNTNGKDNNINISNYLFSDNYSDVPTIDKSEIDIKFDTYELDQKIFSYICSIYVGCVLISFIFYFLLTCCFFKEKKNYYKNAEKDKDKRKNNIGRLFKIIGYIFYCENAALNELPNKEDENTNNLEYEIKEKPGIVQLCCEIINNYCNDTICNMCFCKNEELSNICCCNKYEERHFDKNKQCFCYCYQEKSIFYLINYFFTNDTQKKLIPFLLFYFITKISSIGFQKKYENILQNNDILKEMPIFLFSFSYSFFIFIIILVCFDIVMKKYFEKITKPKIKFKYITMNILICFYLLLNIFFECFSSISHLSENYIEYPENTKLFGDEKFSEKHNLYLNILINKYFLFLLNYYCFIIAKTQIEYEVIFSYSISITIYLIIFDAFIFLLELILNEIKKLFLFQFIITSIFLIIFIIIFVILIRHICLIDICRFRNYEEGDFTCELCCCDKTSKCYNQCCEEKCLDCHCRCLCCEPCNTKIFICMIKILSYYLFDTQLRKEDFTRTSIQSKNIIPY